MKRLLAVTGLATALLLAHAPKAEAAAGFSISIGVPAYTYVEPHYPRATYHAAPVYYERGYERRYARDHWGRGDRWRRHGWRDGSRDRRGHRPARHCDR